MSGGLALRPLGFLLRSPEVGCCCCRQRYFVSAD